MTRWRRPSAPCASPRILLAPAVVIHERADAVTNGGPGGARQDPWLMPDPWVPTLRVARPTDDIDALLPFYVDGLGFQVLTRFEDHQGFSGIVLGHPGQPYHLE